MDREARGGGGNGTKTGVTVSGVLVGCFSQASLSILKLEFWSNIAEVYVR